MSLPRRVRPASAAPRSPVSSVQGLQHVADAADRVDQRLAAGVDLLAQVADVQLDDMGLAAEVVVPDPVQDLRLGQHPARVALEIPEQLELGSGEVDKLAAPADLAGILVHGQVVDRKLALAAGTGQVGPAQQAAQPGEYLFKA